MSFLDHMFIFEQQEILYLLPLPLLIYFLLPPVKSVRNQAALNVPFIDSIKSVSGQSELTSSSQAPLALYLCWILLVIAAAQPKLIGEPVELPAAARDLMIAVDISNSMTIADMKIKGKSTDRLNALKYVMNDFIEQRTGDRLGLILFGSNAYIQTPLTLDTKTVSTFLMEAEIGIAGPNTAIGDAIALTLKRLMENDQSSERILILVTDGADTASTIEPLEAAKLAASESMKIHTIGIGANSMEVPGLFGSRQVNPSRDLDEKTLKGIADVSGGEYFRARNIGDLKDIYALINKIEPVEIEKEVYRPRISIFQYPLTAGFLVSLLIALKHIISPLLISRKK